MKFKRFILIASSAIALLVVVLTTPRTCGAQPSASSIESHPHIAEGCLEGSSCSDYSVPDGKTPDCFTGVCRSGSCTAEQKPDDTFLRTRTVNFCQEESVVCRNGVAEGSNPSSLNNGLRCNFAQEDSNVCTVPGCFNGTCISDHPSLRPQENIVECGDSIVTDCRRIDYKCNSGSCLAQTINSRDGTECSMPSSQTGECYRDPACKDGLCAQEQISCPPSTNRCRENRCDKSSSTGCSEVDITPCCGNGVVETNPADPSLSEECDAGVDSPDCRGCKKIIPPPISECSLVCQSPKMADSSCSSCICPHVECPSGQQQDPVSCACKCVGQCPDCSDGLSPAESTDINCCEQTIGLCSLPPNSCRMTVNCQENVVSFSEEHGCPPCRGQNPSRTKFNEISPSLQGMEQSCKSIKGNKRFARGEEGCQPTQSAFFSVTTNCEYPDLVGDGPSCQITGFNAAVSICKSQVAAFADSCDVVKADYPFPTGGGSCKLEKEVAANSQDAANSECQWKNGDSSTNVALCVGEIAVQCN